MKLTETYQLTQKAFVDPKKRFIINQGGSSSGKTYSTMQLLYLFAQKNNKNDVISVVSENLPHLKRGCIRDIKTILSKDNLWTDKNYNKSEQILKAGSKTIEFFGADSPSKLHGSRRDYLYINEANNISAEAFSQLSIRTRKKIIIDYNPTSEFWAHELIGRDDVAFIKTTYHNNSELEQAIIDNIEMRKYLKKDRVKGEILEAEIKDLENRLKDGGSKELSKELNKKKKALNEIITDWYKVYGMGELGSLEGAVYKNWSQCDSFPWDANKLTGFIDFGFTNDPCAIGVAGVYDQSVYCHELSYKTGMTNPMIAQKIKDLKLDHLQFICDSAEPKSIQELKALKIKAIPAEKKAGSINYGIDLLKEYPVFVTKESLNAVKEFRQYQWKVDKMTNKPTNDPIDDWNHFLDGFRYWALINLKKKTGARFNSTLF